MADLLKLSKRYVINTNSVNNQGFRLLSEGVDKSKYVNNSIMLWMHYRACGATKTEVLPLGNVRELEIDANGVMTGQPYFDGSDDFALTIYNKYENGTLNMFSIGALPMEASFEPEDMLPGQTGPTITKSLLKEISAVDIGGNPEAYGVALYDENDKQIQLSDEFIKSLIPNQNTESMKLTTIGVAALLPMLKLADTVGENEVIEVLKSLVTLRDTQAEQIITLKDENAKALQKATEMQTKYDALVKTSGSDKIIALADKAVLDRLVTRKEVDVLVKMADGKIELLQEVLDTKTASPSIREVTTTKIALGDDAEIVKLKDMTYDELFEKDGALYKLRDADPEAYEAKLNAKFPNRKSK